jgi:NAD+ kinase
MKKVLLFVNPHKVQAIALADEIEEELKRSGVEAVFYTGTAVQGEYDLAFSLGGDGTVLYVARRVAPLGVPVLPINLGTLGFISAVSPDEWKMVFERLCSEQSEKMYSKRLMLEISVERRGKTTACGSCLNDAVISASGIAKMLRLRVVAEDNGKELHLGRYRSDGLIAATPTGSTAYSVAAGGPILDPEMEALILNPICPFTLSNRPLVLPSNEKLIIEVEAEQRSGVLLTLDGQVTKTLEPADKIVICRAPYEARIASSGRRSFYRALRTKLAWV